MPYKTKLLRKDKHFLKSESKDLVVFAHKMFYIALKVSAELVSN